MPYDKDKDDKKKHGDPSESGRITAEIFAAGKWNGMTFSSDDLHAIASNFAKFGDVLKVPLKFGHNDEQPMTDGQPALGWVERVWVEGQKLMAEFADVPTKVMDAIRKRLYRKVSCELDCDVQHKGEKHRYVLSGVALLGADIPAVSTLADLDAYMMQRAAFSAGRRLAFAAIAGEYDQQLGGTEMEQLEKLTKQVAELTSAVAALTDANSKLSLSRTEAEAKLARLEQEAKDREAVARKTASDAKRNEITAVFDAAIKSGAITPAQKLAFAKVLRVEDDAAVDAIAIDDVRAMVAGNKASFAAQGSGQGNGAGDDDAAQSASAVVASKAHKLMGEGKAKTFATAMQMVFAADPALARRYINSNDEEV